MTSGRNDRAVVLARAAVERLDPDVDLERWAAANDRLSRVMWGSGQMDEALAILETTAGRLGALEGSATRARVLATLAGSYMLRGDHPKAIEAATMAIAEARATDGQMSEGPALNTLGTSTALSGRCSEGIPILRESFELAKASDDVDEMGRGFANLGSVLLICGAAEESMRVALDGVAWARTVGASRGFGRFIAANAVDAAVQLGRWDDAQEIVDEYLVGEPEGVNRLSTTVVMGPLYARRGRFAEAERILAARARVGRRVARGPVHWTHLRRGRRTGAVDGPASTTLSTPQRTAWPV